MALDRKVPPAPTYEEWLGLRRQVVAQRLATRTRPTSSFYDNLPGGLTTAARPSNDRPLIQRVLDVVTAPLAGVTSALSSGIDEQKEALGKRPDETLTFTEGLRGLLAGLNNADAFGEGLSDAAIRGEPDYAGEIIDNWLGAEGRKNIDNPFEKIGLGTATIAGDVALDPLTYLPFGFLTKAAKAKKGIPDEYLTGSTGEAADKLARVANPNIAKQTGTQNRMVRTTRNDQPLPPRTAITEPGGAVSPPGRIFEVTPSSPVNPRVQPNTARVVQTPTQRAQAAVRGLPEDDLAKAAGVPDLAPASILPEAQLAKIDKLATRRVRVDNMAKQAGWATLEKYGQRWKQSAINNGMEPAAVDAAYNAVKADVDRMLMELEETVSAARRGGISEEQASTLRQVGINSIKVDTEKLMKEAATSEMTARELTERIAARRSSPTTKAADIEPNPVVEGSASPSAGPVNPETVSPSPASASPASTPEDIGRMIDEAAEEAEVTKATQSAKDTKKVVTVRPAGKKRAQILNELKNENGPHISNFNERLANAINIAISGHTGRKLTQKQINAVRAELKMIVVRRLDRMEKASGGRFNQFEQGNLWEDVIKYARRTAVQAGPGKAGLYGQLGIRWNKEGAKQYQVARELYLALEPYMLDASAGTIWNGVRKGSNKRWALPTAEEIATGTFDQAAKAPAKGKKPYNANVHFSFGQLLRDMPDEIFNKVFLKDQPPGPYGIAVSNAAFWKAREYLTLIPDADVRKWLRAYDSIGHAATRAKAYANMQNPAADAAIEATARNMAKSAETKSGPQIAADAAAAENTTSTAAVGAGADNATTVKAGVEGKAVAQDIADEAIHGSGPIGVANKKAAPALNNPTNSKRGQKRQNTASVNVHRKIVQSYRGESLVNIQRAGLKGRVSDVNTPGMSIDSFSVDESFKARLGHFFRTNYEKVNIYPVWQNSYGALHEIQASVGKAYDSLTRTWLKSTPENRNALVSAAMVMSRQIDEAVIAGDQVAMAALQDLRKFENLIGSPLVERFRTGTTTATKAGLEMEHVNRWIRYQGVQRKSREMFQFKSLDEGHWLDSLYGEEGIFKGVTDTNIDDVVHQMHSVEKALIGAASERSFVDDFISRGFGTPNPSKAKEGWVKLESETLPYMDGVYVHPEIAEQAKAMVHFMDELKKPEPGGAILRFFDQGLRAFKTGVTIYNPQHHVRNAVGDLWLHYADNGRIKHYNRAASIMNKYPYVWKKGGEFEVLGASEEFLTGRGQLATKNDRVIYTKNGQTGQSFTDRDIVEAFHQRGLAIPAENIEDLLSVTREGKFNDFLDKPLVGGSTIRSPFKGSVHNFWSNVSMKREHTARLAHMIHGVEDTPIPKNILKRGDKAVRDYILDEAVRRTRQWHPDGLDLTRGERRYGRRLIPFYSWQRKSIPLVLLAAARRPVLYTYERKVSDAMGTATGEQSDYLPGDQLFPTWLRGSALSASWGTVQDKESGSYGHRLMQGPGTPGTDFLEMILGDAVTPAQVPSATLKDVGSQVNPMFRGPAEIVGNRKWQTGEEVRNTKKANAFPDYFEYIAENSGVPYAGVLSRGNTNKNPANIDLLNWLTGASVIDTGGYDTAAQLSQRDEESYLRDRAR